MKRCPYCAAELKPGAADCPNCKKAFGDTTRPDEEKTGPTNLDSYSKTVIPWWICAIVVSIFLIGLLLIFIVKQ